MTKFKFLFFFLLIPFFTKAENNLLFNKWLNIEGKRIWEFKTDGLLVLQSTNPNNPTKQNLKFSNNKDTLNIFNGEELFQSFKIIKLSEDTMKLLDAQSKKAFHFISLKNQISKRKLSTLLSGNSFQTFSKNKRRVIVFQASGDFIILENTASNKFLYQWEIKNIAGFNFLFFDKEMHSVITAANNKTLTIGQLTKKWKPKVYEKINYKISKAREDIVGKWIFTLNNKTPVLELKLKKSGTGTWKPLVGTDQKKKITWKLEAGIPILKIIQSKNQYLELLILDLKDNQLIVEELNTFELRGGVRKMYGRK